MLDDLVHKPYHRRKCAVWILRGNGEYLRCSGLNRNGVCSWRYLGKNWGEFCSAWLNNDYLAGRLGCGGICKNRASQHYFWAEFNDISISALCITSYLRSAIERPGIEIRVFSLRNKDVAWDIGKIYDYAAD